MKKNSLVIAGLFLGLFAWGCGSSDTTTETPAEDGGAGAGGGTAGAGGGTAGAAGSTAGAGGGTAGAGGGTAGAGGAATFWEAAYDAAGNPSVASGEHKAGQNCQTCHSGGGAPAWLFAGTMHKADGATAAPHVEVGIKSGGKLFTAYSGANGNFFVLKGSNTIDFAAAEIRIRNANGEKKMSSAAAAGCNSCHAGAQALIEP